MLRRHFTNNSCLISITGFVLQQQRHQSTIGGRRKSSWTALLDDDVDAQIGNLKRSQAKVDERLTRAFKQEVRKGTPPELRDSYINDQTHMHPDEKARIQSQTELEAVDRATQISPTSGTVPTYQQNEDGVFTERPPLPTNIPARAGLWSPEHPARGSGGSAIGVSTPRSFYGSVEEDETNAMNSRRHQRRAVDKEHFDEYAMRVGNQTRPKRESAMSRFFKDNQARDFAAKKYEDEDKARFSPPMPKFDEAMRSAGFSFEAQREANEPSPTQQAKVMLDELDASTSTASAGGFAKENPYDSYRQLSTANTGDASFEISEQTRANRSVIPGLGPLLDTIYWRIEQSSEYKTNKAQKEDKTIPFYKRVFADIDIYDRRTTMHILSMYPMAEWFFALISAASIFFMTDYQYNHRLLSTYDEILGLDARRGGERLEYIMVFVVSFFVYRFFLFHPFVVSAIGLTRTGRYLMGRPLGP